MGFLRILSIGTLDPQWMYNELLGPGEDSTCRDLPHCSNHSGEKRKSYSIFRQSPTTYSRLLYHILTILRAGEKMLGLSPSES